MELSSSKRIKVESKPTCSQQQLVGSNLLDHVTSSRSLIGGGGSDPDLNFDTLKGTQFFVDKSMLIRTIMKDKAHRILLTAPPRFGKTMACSMLEMFFEIVNDEQEKKYELFKGLKIYKCTEECTDNHDCESKRFFHEHYGQHPVISMDFAQLSTDSYTEFLDSLRDVVTEQFLKYDHLIRKDAQEYSWLSSNMGKLDINDFLDYMVPTHEDKYWIKASDDLKGPYILRAFRYLIKVVSAHYQTEQTHKKIIVLVDEFDAPFMELLFDSDCPSKKIIILIRKLMRLLCKDKMSAQFVGRVVIFSVTAFGGIISLGANNVQRRTFLDKNYDYYKFFGFTKEEVDALVKSTVTEIQRQKEVLDEIAVWYNNYTVIGDNDTTICNPVSITMYLPNFVRESYWVASVGTKHVCKLFKFEKIREKLFHAIRDDHNISINATTIYLDDISLLKSLSESMSNCINDQQVDLVLQFLAECGYFNIIEKKDTNWILQIPNQELRKTFTDELYNALKYICESVKTNLFDVKQQETFVNALQSLRCGEPMKYVTFKQSVENLYTNRELPKAHFHFHCDLWMLIFASEKFKCFSELPIKKGWSPKIDLMIITKSAAIIIEVKRHKQDSAKKALKQCLQKEYYKAFELEEKKGKVLNKILMGLHLSDDGKVSIRYLENFEEKTLSDKQNRNALIKTIVEASHEC